MSTPRYLVTGGAGFIGTNIVAALVAAGERVRVLDNLATGMWENLDGISPSSAVERIEGDIRDPEAVAKAAAGVEVVFHEAALGSVPRSVEDPVTSDAVNVGGTVTVLDVSRRVGVRRVVFAASSSAYGETPVLPKREDMQPMPLSPYAVTKLACESYCRVVSSIYGLETMCLRYFNVFGPHQTPEGPYAAAIPRFVDAALAGRPIQIFGDGEQVRPHGVVDEAEVARLLAAASPRKLAGEVVNIAGGRRVSLNALCVEIGRVLGRALDVEHGPARPGDVRHSLADVSLAREILGYEPSVRWEEGIAPTVAYLEALRAAGPAEAAQRAAERRAQSLQESGVSTGAATNVVALFR
ncbi:MAG TPA: NAD-dependent epimerase/dehydratase family protein [Polyangium sp.]|nr:NAD-dependent epimerase/dehydratase family protein [Polyangium sp.]